jgi:hypothetical protein
MHRPDARRGVHAHPLEILARDEGGAARLEARGERAPSEPVRRRDVPQDAAKVLLARGERGRDLEADRPRRDLHGRRREQPAPQLGSDRDRSRAPRA